MKLRVLGLVAALMMSTPALAAWDVDAITQQYKADGFTRIEIKIGPTQAKVEAIKDGTKVEVIYDLASGDVLKRESEVISADESSATGVSVRNTERDFLVDVGSTRSNDDDDDDDVLDDNGRDDDDSADDNSGRGGDDDEDDDESDDNSGGGDDDGPDHDSGDDNGGSDNSGSGSSDDDDGDDESEDD